MWLVVFICDIGIGFVFFYFIEDLVWFLKDVGVGIFGELSLVVREFF